MTGLSDIINLSAYYADRLTPAVKAGAGQIQAKRRTPCPAENMELWNMTGRSYYGDKQFTQRAGGFSR